jgi:hypothetical protein
MPPHLEDNRVICNMKFETMGVAPNLEFMRINTKSSQVFFMLKLPHIMSGVRVLKFGFLAYHARMGGSR